MNHLREFLSGFVLVVNLYPTRRSYVVPSAKRRQAHAARMYGDWVRVGSDLKKTTTKELNRHGAQHVL